MRNSLSGMVIAVLLAVALSVTLWLGWSKWGAESESARLAVQSSNDSPAVGKERLAAESRPGHVAPREVTPAPELVPEPPAFSTHVDPSQALTEAACATSVRQLQELAARARAAGDEALARQLELMEDETCGTLVRDDVADHIDPGSEGYRRWEEFCAGTVVDPLADNHLQRMKILDQYQSEVISALDKMLESPDWTGMDEALMQLLVESGNPMEIEAVALLLANGLIELETDSAFLLGHRQLDAIRALMVQNASLELYSCERFGHCGPQSMQSIEACLLIPECEPGHDYLALMSWIMAPRELDLARQIVDLIREFEARRGG